MHAVVEAFFDPSSQAAFLLNQGPKSKQKRIPIVIRPAFEQYVCKLLYLDLCKSKTEKVLKLLRKIHWDDPAEADMVITCLRSVWLVKYPDIRYDHK